MIIERVRKEAELYPDYTAEINAIEQSGITDELLQRIINKHQLNSEFNKALYKRYEGLQGEVPISNRIPRFANDKEAAGIINNKIANDFMGEIVDFKTGYFAGSPIAYSYSSTEESEEDTAGSGIGGVVNKLKKAFTVKSAEKALKEAKKALSDFVTRNNMHNVDLVVTKYASVYGYAARLFYHDPKDGAERVMPIHGYEAVILSKTNISEPQYGVRYFRIKDINDIDLWKAEFYDDATIRYYEGSSIADLHLVREEVHLYGLCPLQGIPNNDELMGDAENVLTLIDAYDRTVSDSSNQIEGDVWSKTIYKNVQISDEAIAKSNYTGAIVYVDPSGVGDIYKLQNNVNDSYTQNHLDRIKNDIYRFSKTPNLSDEAFGSASGVSLKFKLHGLETKCSMFEAKMITAGVYMFKLLENCFLARRIPFDSLQCVMEPKRNFPLDILSEAQAAQALIAAGVPEEVAYQVALQCIDDIDYVMQLKEAEKDDIPSLFDKVKEDDETDIDDEDKPIKEDDEDVTEM